MKKLEEANRNTTILWILQERERQKMRWTEDHDDMHTDQDWSVILARLSLEEKATREKLVRVAATAFAALEAHIRFEQQMRATGPGEC